MEDLAGFAAPEGAAVVYQHWPGCWRVAEGTWDWAASVGFRAVAMESQDHFEGPPTRAAFRTRYFLRSEQMHGTGELVSWTRGRELAGMGLDAVLAGIEEQFKAFTAGSAEPAEVERRICDLFMAARCGDFLDRLLQHLRQPKTNGWEGAIRKALEVELVTKERHELLEGHPFWRRGVMPELVSALPEHQPEGLVWKEEVLRFGKLVLWSPGACGQILREAIHADWTDLVLEQGLVPTLRGKNALDPKNHSFARWLWSPLHRRCQEWSAQRSRQGLVDWCLTKHRLQQLDARGEFGWKVEPRHWARIVEWVLVWRREITNPAMLQRAQAFAALILNEELGVRRMGDENPVAGLEQQHETPRAAGDIPVRLHTTVRWAKPNDHRLTDELYPAIAAAVAGWLRGAGLSACREDVFSAASWLPELLGPRRLRATDVLKAANVVAARPRGAWDDDLPKSMGELMGLGPGAVTAWLEEQAFPCGALERMVDLARARDPLFSGDRQENLLERLDAQPEMVSPGIQKDLLWGLICVVLHLRDQPLADYVVAAFPTNSEAEEASAAGSC